MLDTRSLAFSFLRGCGKADGGLRFRKADLEGLCRTAGRRRPTRKSSPSSLGYRKTLEKQEIQETPRKENSSLRSKRVSY